MCMSPEQGNVKGNVKNHLHTPLSASFCNQWIIILVISFHARGFVISEVSLTRQPTLTVVLNRWVGTLEGVSGFVTFAFVCVLID